MPKISTEQRQYSSGLYFQISVADSIRRSGDPLLSRTGQRCVLGRAV